MSLRDILTHETRIELGLFSRMDVGCRAVKIMPERR